MMILTASFGVLSVVFIMARPLRLIAKPPFAGFGSKAFASMFFCLAGVAAAAQRERLNWQAAALLFGFCLACIGDVLLAAEPILANPERDKGYAFLLGGAPFLLAHGINLTVLLSIEKASLMMIPLTLALPALYLIFWRTGLLKLGKAGVPLVIYAAILSAMCAAALQILRHTPGPLGYFVFPAALLFACSDTALFFFNFGRSQQDQPPAAQPNQRSNPSDHFSGAFSWLVMFPYYIGQALLAFAVAML